MTKRRKRTYPFSEPQGTTGTTNTVTWIWPMMLTVYKPNPFHGIDRWLFAFDEWGHRNLPTVWARRPMCLFCNWWDRRLGER